jgi:hypothetical protein
MWNKKKRRVSRRTDKRKRRGGSSRKAPLIAGIIGVPVLAVTAGWFALDGIMDQKKIDPVTFCYEENNQYQAAFFADVSFTHSTSKAQDRDFQNALLRARAALPPNGRLSIFTTARYAGSTLVEPVFTICRPPSTPEGMARIGAPDKPTPYLKRQAKDAEAAYRAMAARILIDAKDKAKTALDSPILEQIQAISRYVFKGPLRLFYVFTDGIQISELAQFCRTKGHLPPFKSFIKKKGLS